MADTMGAADTCQRQLGFVGSTQHQVLAIHGDNKVIVMLDERQQAAVRGLRRGELGSIFHGYGKMSRSARPR
jgi:hypothetical protein